MNAPLIIAAGLVWTALAALVSLIAGISIGMADKRDRQQRRPVLPVAPSVADEVETWLMERAS